MIGFYNYTVVATYLATLLGLCGIFFSLEGQVFSAIVCLLLAGLLDTVDGRIARTKKDRTADEQRFGIQIDSLVHDADKHPITVREQTRNRLHLTLQFGKASQRDIPQCSEHIAHKRERHRLHGIFFRTRNKEVRVGEYGWHIPFIIFTNILPFSSSFREKVIIL